MDQKPGLTTEAPNCHGINLQKLENIGELFLLKAKTIKLSACFTSNQQDIEAMTIQAVKDGIGMIK